MSGTAARGDAVRRPALREILGPVPAWGTPGTHNAITDVPGVRVGHVSVSAEGPHCTGVTAILPHGGDLFREKLPAAATVINGYGKMTGLAQIAELGTLETPILLTNTLAVGSAWDACVGWMLSRFDRDEDPIRSINPVVAECNDGRLAEIRERSVTAEHVSRALDDAADGPVAQGCVGAGTGMVAFGWKSGVGTASREVILDAGRFVVGALALPNLGTPEQLVIRGVPVGRRLPRPPSLDGEEGSIVVVVATDLPCSHRQLGRISRRAAVGIARTGGTGDGTSGEFAVAFGTANRLPPMQAAMLTERRLDDRAGTLDPVLRAVADATEEAILSALFTAVTTLGREGCVATALPIARVIACLEDPVLGSSRRA
jgi:D-aminopeptidase